MFPQTLFSFTFDIKNKIALTAEFPKIDIIPITETNSSKKFSNLLTSFSIMLRSSLPEGFCGKGVLRNLVKFTGKYLCLRQKEP